MEFTNCVLTELGKQSTEARHANLAATTKKSAVSANKTAGAPERAAGTAILEPHEYMEYSGRFGRKEDLIKDMTDKLKRLSPEDQVILALWMQDSTTYVDKVRDELGLPELSNNAICIRCNKAKNKLRSLMKGARVDYRDIYVPRRADIIDGGAYEVATPGIDRNTVRRNRRAAGASITKGIDYARVGELMIRKISEK